MDYEDLEDMYWDSDVDAVYDCLLVSNELIVRARAARAELHMKEGNKTVECPGEAHVKDGCFNPSSQGPYGDGAFNCDLCENTGEITPEDYMEWSKHVILFLDAREARRIAELEAKEQEKLIKELMKGPVANVPKPDK